MYQPLGLLYIAAAAKEACRTVKFIDCREGEKYKETLPLEMQQSRYVGFTATTPELAFCIEWAKRCYNATIIGGPHATLRPQDCEGHFDYVVVGEGEQVIRAILADYYEVQPRTIRPPRIKNLDDVPIPDWEITGNGFSPTLFPGERYGLGPPAATMILSRGCPFSCAFCGNWLRTPVVYRSVENIEKEIDYLVGKGVQHFRFEDDNLTIHPDLKDLCKMLQSKAIHFKAHTRSDLVKAPIMVMLKEAGLEEFGLGIESADDDVLMLNRKKETVAQHLEACRIIKKAGIRLKTYFMSGLPGETGQTLQLNMEFVRKAKPDKWTLSIFTPYPGCDIFASPEQYGVHIIDKDLSHYWNFPDAFTYELDTADREILERRYRRFYKWLVEETWRK